MIRRQIDSQCGVTEHKWATESKSVPNAVNVQGLNTQFSRSCSWTINSTDSSFSWFIMHYLDWGPMEELSFTHWHLWSRFLFICWLRHVLVQYARASSANLHVTQLNVWSSILDVLVPTFRPGPNFQGISEKDRAKSASPLLIRLSRVAETSPCYTNYQKLRVTDFWKITYMLDV